MKNHLVALSLFCCAVSILVGSWLLAERFGDDTNNEAHSGVQKQLLTATELATYLGIEMKEVELLTKVYDKDTGVSTSVIPHIEIEGNVYYPTQAIDQWLQNMESLIVP